MGISRFDMGQDTMFILAMVSMMFNTATRDPFFLWISAFFFGFFLLFAIVSILDLRREFKYNMAKLKIQHTKERATLVFIASIKEDIKELRKEIKKSKKDKKSKSIKRR